MLHIPAWINNCQVSCLFVFSTFGSIQISVVVVVVGSNFMVFLFHLFVCDQIQIHRGTSFQVSFLCYCLLVLLLFLRSFKLKLVRGSKEKISFHFIYIQIMQFFIMCSNPFYVHLFIVCHVAYNSTRLIVAAVGTDRCAKKATTRRHD